MTDHADTIRRQAEQRVYTNELDALEALIVEGLPPEEMQAAAWALVQRVRGLHDDLRRLERARAGWQREAHVIWLNHAGSQSSCGGTQSAGYLRAF